MKTFKLLCRNFLYCNNLVHTSDKIPVMRPKDVLETSEGIFLTRILVQFILVWNCGKVLISENWK